MSLLGLAARGKLELIGNVLSDRGLSSALRLRIGEYLIGVVLGASMVWEILSILALDDEVELSEFLQRASGQQLHLMRPYHCHSHVLPGVCDDSTRQVVGIDSHEAFLIETEIGEELRILPEMSRQLLGWLIDSGEVTLLMVCILEDVLILEQASLTDEDLDVVVNWEEHELPVDRVEDRAFHGDDDVRVISLMHHIIKCVSPWVLGLQILSGYEQCHKRDQDSIIVPILWHLR